MAERGSWGHPGPGSTCDARCSAPDGRGRLARGDAGDSGAAPLRPLLPAGGDEEPQGPRSQAQPDSPRTDPSMELTQQPVPALPIQIHTTGIRPGLAGFP
ncbi:unnamed protein product [Caretta caretta]